MGCRVSIAFWKRSKCLQTVLDCRVGATALVRPSMLSDGWAQLASPPRSLHSPRMMRCFPATHDCQSEQSEARHAPLVQRCEIQCRPFQPFCSERLFAACDYTTPGGTVPAGFCQNESVHFELTLHRYAEIYILQYSLQALFGIRVTLCIGGFLFLNGWIIDFMLQCIRRPLGICGESSKQRFRRCHGVEWLAMGLQRACHGIVSGL
jgi:hypothetical protein